MPIPVPHAPSPATSSAGRAASVRPHQSDVSPEHLARAIAATGATACEIRAFLDLHKRDRYVG